MDIKTFWQYSTDEILNHLNCNAGGLTSQHVAEKLAALRSGQKKQSPLLQNVKLFLSQFTNPLVLLLIAAVILSAFLGETSDVFIILFILLFTGILSYIQERRAGKAVEKLLAVIQKKAKVIRDGQLKDIPADEVVAGDILSFTAGDVIPADCFLIESKMLQANESKLTGESMPAEKKPCVLPQSTAMSQRSNVLYAGTNIISGQAKAIAVLTGKETVFGAIAADMQQAPQETAFEAGIKKFGYFLMKVTLVICVLIFSANILLGKPLIDSLLFGLALAVGMAPELLPAIMTIAMSHGAKRMAQQKVIVKKLSSIQNLGEVNLFCSDKTGTLTEGILEVHAVIDVSENENSYTKQLAFLNAHFESGFANPMDEALIKMQNVSATDYTKLNEIPYDFNRKRLSICVKHNAEQLLITKGAVNNVLQVCTQVLQEDNSFVSMNDAKNKITAVYTKKSNEGFRMIGVAYKTCTAANITIADESEMIFAGFVLLSDPPKQGIADEITSLKKIGVDLVMITGDNKLIAAYTAQQIGLQNIQVLSGEEIQNLTKDELSIKLAGVNVFAEIEPQQKENIIKAFKKAGNVVAYMGDGINDVNAINAADVGISINNAVDIAKEAADVVLLEKNLAVLNNGIIEGRKTFLNTIKYLYINTSATFGNMFSMAGASVILPFLPMLPQQILLANFVTDFPYMAIASDNADKDQLNYPQKWNIRRLRNFMIVFGVHSSFFDFITFYALFKLHEGNEKLFQTGWFLESVFTELLILFVVRTHKMLWRSLPGKGLIVLTLLAFIITIALPFSLFATALGFVVPPEKLLIVITGIVLTYVITADLLNFIFFKRRKPFRQAV
jgi:Mg2+-importing ATPase